MVYSSDPRFQDPRWISFRSETMLRLDHKCEECGSPDSVAIYISHWEKGKAPWAFHPSAYHSLCSDHRNRRKNLENFLSAILSKYEVGELDALTNVLEYLAATKSNRRWITAMLYPCVKRLAHNSNENSQRRAEEEWKCDPSME